MSSQREEVTVCEEPRSMDRMIKCTHTHTHTTGWFLILLHLAVYV